MALRQVNRQRGRQRRRPLPYRGPYPVGRSPLELLPVELLIQIFIYSQNVKFPITSKAIHNVLGVSPSWLLMAQFFLYPAETRGTPTAIINAKRAGFHRAIRSKGFSIHHLCKWREGTDRGMPSYTSFLDRRVPLEKRWLRPENIEILMELLRQPDGVYFPPKWSCAPRTTPLFYAIHMGSQMKVSFEWLVTLKECLLLHAPSEEELRGGLWYIFCSAMKRKDITCAHLDRLRFQIDDGLFSFIGNAVLLAMEPKNPVLARWALDNGVVPPTPPLAQCLPRLLAGSSHND
jgi:hypothetical protein